MLTSVSDFVGVARPKVMVESEHDEGSEDNEEDWTYPETRKTAGQKRPRTKDKTFTASSSPHKGGRGPGRPSKQQLKGVKESGNDSQERERDSMLAENGRNVEGHSQGGGGADFHSLKVSVWGFPINTKCMFCFACLLLVSMYVCVCVRVLNWRTSKTLSGITQLKIGDICLYVWIYVCHFVL